MANAQLRNGAKNVQRLGALWIALPLVAYSFCVCFGQTPTLQPDCSALTPEPCDVIPDTDSHGDYTYESYTESCNDHECVTITPQSTSYTWSASPSSPTITIQPWFCNVSMVNYQARVEANTGLPPGKKEDQYAQCNYLRLMNLLGLGNCRDVGLWTCMDCAEAYKFWVCAMVFPQCVTFTSHLSLLGTVTTQHVLYGTQQHGSFNISYTIIKPCRGLCFEVFRKCPYAIGFQCPIKNKRDYNDWPGCNNVGNPNAIPS